MRVVCLSLLLAVVVALPTIQDESTQLVQTELAATDDDEADTSNFTGMPGIPIVTTNSSLEEEEEEEEEEGVGVTVSKSVYRDLLKEELCDYLYDLATYLKPKYYADEPIRENLLISSEEVECWQEDQGADFLKADLFRPVRGDQGPWPNSGFPYVLHAKLEDGRVLAVNIKYDDDKVLGADLYAKIAEQMGVKDTNIVVYRLNHPVDRVKPLSDLNLKFQDYVTVDLDVSKHKAESDGNTIQNKFFHHTGDGLRSLSGIAP